MKRASNTFCVSACLAAFLAASAHANPQSAADFQWTFQAACLHSQPALVERGAAQLAENLGLDRLEAIDVDAFWLGDGGLMISVNGNPLSTICTIALPQSQITDDVATFQRVIGARIEAKADDSAVTLKEEDGLMQWSWVRSEVTFAAELEARDGQYTLTVQLDR